MSKGIILYQSKYGATKKYAQWLQEATGFECVETQKVDIIRLQDYDDIVFGGGVYASGVWYLSFLKKNIESLLDKKIAVFYVAASPYDEKAYNQMREMHFKDKLQSIPSFHCRGAWDLDSLNFTDKTLCKMLLKAVAKQDPSTYEPWQKALSEAGTQKCDWTDKKYLDELIAYIKSE